MKLSISLAAAAVILRFTTPGPGSYYVYSTTARNDTARMEASNHTTNAVHVAVPLPNDGAHRIFWVWFIADSGKQQPLP